jgi:methylglyoxal synthase
MIVGTFAMYFKDPTEATPHDLDFAATLSRTAASIISPNDQRAA